MTWWSTLLFKLAMNKPTQHFKDFALFLYMWLNVRLRRCHHPKNAYTFWYIRYFKIQLLAMVKLSETFKSLKVFITSFRKLYKIMKLEE